jgi:hypothetical protein
MITKHTKMIILMSTIMLTGIVLFAGMKSTSAYTASITNQDATGLVCPAYSVWYDTTSYQAALSADDSNYANVNLGSGGGPSPAIMYFTYYGNVHNSIPVERRNHYYFTQLDVPWICLNYNDWFGNEIDSVYIRVCLSTGAYYDTMISADWPDGTLSGTVSSTDSGVMAALNAGAYVSELHFNIYVHSGVGNNYFQVDYLAVIYYYTYELQPSAPQNLANTATHNSITITWTSPPKRVVLVASPTTKYTAMARF